MTTLQRRTTRLRPIHIVLTVLLAFAGIVVIAGPARAAVDTIEGTVTTPANTSGINVYLSQDLTTGSGPVFALAPVTTDAAGHFEFTGVPNGDYLVVIDAGDDWVQDFFFASVDGVLTPTPTLVDLVPGVALYGTVRDVQPPFSPLAGVSVAAVGDFGVPYFDWLSLDFDAPSGLAPITGVAGQYRIVVPLDDNYEVAALDQNELYGEQSWDHRDGCGCDFDPVVVPGASGWPYAPITALDFDLRAYDNWIYFSVLAEHLNASPKVVRVYLDKWDGTDWVQVETGVTDASGFVDLFGEGDGDYRLRYSRSGVFLAVHSWYEPNYFVTYPLYDGGKSVELDGLLTACGCGGFTTLEVDLVFPNPPSGGGSGTATRPTSSGPPSFSLPTSTPTATPTPTPTPTPTSGPTPSSSPEPGESPSPSATPEPTPTGDVGFPWWIILIVLLILGIIITIIVFVRRR